MKQSLLHVALVVRDYDEAIEFFCGKLNFKLIEDTCHPEQDKRWVVVAPPGSFVTPLAQDLGTADIVKMGPIHGICT